MGHGKPEPDTPPAQLSPQIDVSVDVRFVPFGQLELRSTYSSPVEEIEDQNQSLVYQYAFPTETALV